MRDDVRRYHNEQERYDGREDAGSGYGGSVFADAAGSYHCEEVHQRPAAANDRHHGHGVPEFKVSEYFRHPDGRPEDGRYQMDTDDGALGLGDVDLTEPQRTGNVRLPVGTVEQGHGAETLEEHPPWIVSELAGYARR